jgi:molybdopterin molybdotransferase
MKPPPLKNNCFAMPPGVDWTPVDDALARLRDGLSVVVGSGEVPLERSGGRVLAADAVAQRSNPPYANSAVDGFGFRFADLPDTDIIDLPLCSGRAAAGAPFRGVVPAGHAIRILTGAALPEGVDTVVLEEDTTFDEARIAFRRGLKKGANTRRAGEDFADGNTIMSKGRRLGPPDLALAAAAGLDALQVYDRLRVGVLSTGAEIIPVGATAAGHQIYDANRPMLLDIIRQWGFEPVDLGHVGDDRSQLRETLDAAAPRVDAVLTSGGASAGDEDHVSAILRAEGSLQTWRIAVKPGRPLAMALWNGVPVFGLPGNPVAAFVCTLIFGYPALCRMSGRDWPERLGFDVPAGFAKSKRAGRREFLRARINGDGQAEAFKSEGSGRISGLSWATGLVELPDAEAEIAVGDPVRFLPYSGFGLSA